MASFAALPSAPAAFILAIVSYQMPTSALPKFGLSFTTAVLTTIRSMISPGICDESNTFVRVRCAEDLETMRIPCHHRGRLPAS